MNLFQGTIQLTAAVAFLLLAEEVRGVVLISPEEYLMRNDVCSLRCEQARASVANDARFAVEGITADREAIAHRYRKLVAHYVKERDALDPAGTLLKVNNETVRLLVSWVPVIGYAMDKLLDGTEKLYERGRIDGTRRAARLALKEIEAHLGAARSRELATATPAEREAVFSALLSDTAEDILGPAFVGISDQAVRDELQNAIIRQLADNLEEVARTKLVQDQKIEDLLVDLADLRKAFEQSDALRAQYSKDLPPDKRLRADTGALEGTTARQLKQLFGVGGSDDAEAAQPWDQALQCLLNLLDLRMIG